MSDEHAIDGKHCPECRRDIGVWPVFHSGWPNLIWCPYCKTRLTYRIGWIGITLLFWGVVLACGICLSIAVILRPRGLFSDKVIVNELLIQFFLFWRLLVLSWALVELVLIQHLRKHGRLERHSPRPMD